jgi:hypothetical protein
VKLDGKTRKRRDWVRLFVALSVGFWVALVWRGPREERIERGWCAIALKRTLAKGQTPWLPSNSSVFLVSDPHTTASGEVPPSFIPAVVAGGARLGVSGACPDCTITLACIENTDADSDYSVWSISSRNRLGQHGELIRAATPYLEHDDEAPLEGAPAYPDYLR